MVGRDVSKVIYSGAATSPSCPQVLFQALLKHVQKCGTHNFLGNSCIELSSLPW